MPWVRVGDTFASDPRFLEVLGLPEAADQPSLVNELRGFVVSLATESAAHLTDYIVNMGTVIQLAGSRERADYLLGICQRTGLAFRREVEGRQVVELVQDPDFIHVRLKKEIEWTRQRKRDNENPNLKGPVLLRDGDQCRYCRREVHWPGKSPDRKATLDHVVPGQAATVETLVVACTRCNTARQDDADGSWAKAHPLLDPPDSPIYTDWTRKYLVKRGLLPALDEATNEKSPDVVDPGRPDQSASAGSPVGSVPDFAALPASAGNHTPASVVDPGSLGGADPVETCLSHVVDPGKADPLASAGSHGGAVSRTPSPDAGASAGNHTPASVADPGISDQVGAVKDIPAPVVDPGRPDQSASVGSRRDTGPVSPHPVQAAALLNREPSAAPVVQRVQLKPRSESRSGATFYHGPPGSRHRQLSSQDTSQSPHSGGESASKSGTKNGLRAALNPLSGQSGCSPENGLVGTGRDGNGEGPGGDRAGSGMAGPGMVGPGSGLAGSGLAWAGSGAGAPPGGGGAGKRRRRRR